MPERHTLVPTSIVTFKTGPHNTSDREELFLLYSKGFEEGRGRGIYRDGIGSPWMWDDDGKRRVTDADEQRRGSWLLDRGLALQIERKSLEAKRKNDRFRDRVRNELGRDPEQVINEWLYELDKTPDYISEFDKVYNPKYQIIGAQGCGNLTMNSWFVGYTRSDFTNGIPTFLYRRDEPFETRTYTCLVKWVDKSYSINPLRFNLYKKQVNLIDLSNNSEKDITDSIELAVFGQQLVKGGQLEDFRGIATQFEDIRHIFKLPNINPDLDLGDIPQGKRDRMLFGAPRQDDVWFGERELRNNENLLRYALTEPILLNRQFENMGAGWNLTRSAFAAPTGGGYRELTGEQSSYPPRSRGEWRVYSDDIIDIYLQRNVYAYTMIGIDNDGDIVASAAGGLAGRVGQTLEGMAQNMISVGARDVLLIDEGNDVFQLLEDKYTVEPKRGRLRAIFIFSKEMGDSSKVNNPQDFQKPAEP